MRGDGQGRGVSLEGSAPGHEFSPSATSTRVAPLPAFALGPRQRDLFPLPFVEEHGFDPSHSVCRAVRRRVTRRHCLEQWVNDGILALSELAGKGLAVPAGVKVSGMAATVVQQIQKQFAQVGPPPSSLLSPEGAIAELLGSSAVYS